MMIYKTVTIMHLLKNFTAKFQLDFVFKKENESSFYFKANRKTLGSSNKRY